MVLTLFLIGVLTYAFTIQLVKASGIIYIRADGSIDPPDTPIQRDGNIYTLTGSITSDTDGIVVERSNIIIDGNGHLVQGSRSGYGFTLSGVSNVTIKNTNIKGFVHGIYLNLAFYNIIFRNNITNNVCQGIRANSSSYNSILENSITKNTYDGGIRFFNSSYNAVLENEIKQNLGGGIVIVDFSSHNNVSRNNITENTLSGVHIYNASYNIIFENSIDDNSNGGVELIFASNNRIVENDITSNFRYLTNGICLSGSSNNYIVRNNITTSYSYGITLVRYCSDSSNNNIIFGNNVANNGNGIYLLSSSDNSIYHNNFIDNSLQAYVNPYADPSINVWNDDYPFGGNYWSDYNGTDLFSGPFQNATGSDGMGDTPYIIDENNIDRYPLMNPWVQPEHELVVSMAAPSALKLGSSSSLNATVTNEGTNDETLIKFSLLINGTTVNSTTIALLQSSSSYTLKYLWTPTIEAAYNITAYAHPVPDEIYVENNRVSKLCTVSATIIVPDTYPTIQAAINAANSGDTILVKEGTYYEHVVINKCITLIGEDRDRTIIDGASTGTVMNITVSKVNVTGFTIQNSGDHYDHGIYVFSSFCNITYNIVKNCRYGIKLDNSTDIIISGNTVTESSFVAVKMDGSSKNTLSRNNITSNRYGIGLDYSLDNTIAGNNITNNDEGGIGLYRSPNNVISLNNITNNRKGIGIPDYPSTNITIYGNKITNNEYGIILIGSGNKIYHNNFIDNTQQAYFMLGSTQPNVWDDGYSGNFWSDYTGVDANGDGIGDTPYIINANNKDRYPLMNPWTPSWVPPEHVTPTPPEVQVGVKAGDWIKVDYTISGWPAGQPYPEWLKVEFLTVEGTNATIRVTMHMSDGTEQNATVPVDVVAGGQALGLSGFVIPANLTVGDTIFMSGYGNVTIEGETTRTYAGASRTVVYASISQYGTQLTYYWDKQTGVLVESSGTSDGMTITAKATETNMWQPELFGLDLILLYSLIIVTIVVVAAVAFLAIRRKKKPPEELENPQS